ncbi:MAG: hypothetical protein RL318_58 [Fibrobacterota bacterium]|jgi:Zn-dependent protease with chaperone function
MLPISLALATALGSMPGSSPSSRLPQDFRGPARSASLDSIIPKNLRESWADEWARRLELRRNMAWKGEVLLSDKAQAYLGRVLDSVLVGQPALRKRMRAYLSPSPFVNAFVLTDGTILVNQGMLSRLETEAQLAMVLAHEAAHYWYHHGPDEWAEKKKEEDSWGGISDRWERTRLQHSRSRELAADSLGLAWLSDSRYGKMSLDSLYGILGASDNALGGRAWDRRAVAGLGHLWNDSAWMSPSQARTAPAATEDDDSLQTHPAIPRRRKALARWIGTSAPGREFLVDSTVFASLKKQAQTVLSARYLETNQPAVAAFEAWSQLEGRERDRSLRQVFARSLVELALEKAAIRNAAPRARRVRSFGAYQTFEHFLEHSPGLLLPCLAIDQMRKLKADAMADSLDLALEKELWSAMPKAWPRQVEAVKDSSLPLARSLRNQKAQLAGLRASFQPLPANPWDLPDTTASTGLTKGMKLLVLPVHWGDGTAAKRMGGRDGALDLLRQELSKSSTARGIDLEIVDPLAWTENDAALVEGLAKGWDWLRERIDTRGISRYRPRLDQLRELLAAHKAQGLMVVSLDLAPRGEMRKTLMPLAVSFSGNPAKTWDGSDVCLMAAVVEPKEGAVIQATVETGSSPSVERLTESVTTLVKDLVESKGKGK